MDSSSLERLPEPGQNVLAFVQTKNQGVIPVIAQYIPRYSREFDDDLDDLGYECLESTDKCYWLEGWYESVLSWYEFSFLKIHSPIIDWQPITYPEECLQNS
jgi:hypothetical protein